jgi:hypothetical protein
MPTDPRTPTITAVVFITIVSALGTAAAQDYPRLTGEFEAEVQLDYAYDGDVGRDQGSSRYLRDLFTNWALGVAFEFTPSWSIQTAVVLEPVRAAAKNRTFDDHGIFVEQLYVLYAPAPFSLFAGKFNPAFGIAWEQTPGVYGRDFAEDYEITEQIGLGATYDLATPRFGRYSFEASAFVADTSMLAKSLATRPRATDANVERTDGRDRSDGGLANTGRVNNFALSLAAVELPGMAGVSWHFAYLSRRAGRTETADERGIASGATYAFALSEASEATLVGEYVHLHDFGGANQTARYFTYGAEIAWAGGWRASLAFTKRDLNPAPGFDDDGRKRLIAGTVGYAFTDNSLQGTAISVGWKSERAGPTSTDTVGLLLTYDLDFEFGLARRQR